MNYTFENNEYVANGGYMFVNKTNGICFTKMSLSVSDSIDNYDCVEIPPEPEIDELDYETAYNELTEVIENAN